jgi:hypothetical protein
MLPDCRSEGGYLQIFWIWNAIIHMFNTLNNKIWTCALQHQPLGPEPAAHHCGSSQPCMRAQPCMITPCSVSMRFSEQCYTAAGVHKSSQPCVHAHACGALHAGVGCHCMPFFWRVFCWSAALQCDSSQADAFPIRLSVGSPVALLFDSDQNGLRWTPGQDRVVHQLCMSSRSP